MFIKQVIHKAVAVMCVAALAAPLACTEKKTRKLTIEGPEKKTEVKLETSKTKKDKDD